jgi:hypothetical protein
MHRRGGAVIAPTHSQPYTIRRWEQNINLSKINEFLSNVFQYDVYLTQGKIIHDSCAMCMESHQLCKYNQCGRPTLGKIANNAFKPH